MMTKELVKPFLAIIPALVLLAFGTGGTFSGSVSLRMTLAAGGMLIYGLVLWFFKPQGRKAFVMDVAAKQDASE
jgi:uncharacterized transporter YbjL